MLNVQPAGLRLSKETMETLEVEVEFGDHKIFFGDKYGNNRNIK